MIPPIIHQAWFGSRPMPENMRLWQETIRQKHPAWKFHLWSEESCLDIGELKHKLSTHGSVTNILRLVRLGQMGGVWLDTDIECFRPLDGLLNTEAFAAYDGGTYDFGCYQGGEKKMVCNAVMGAVPGAAWIKRQLRLLPAFYGLEPPWGPKLATETLARDVTLHPTHFFYPRHWAEPPSQNRSPETYLEHHWSGSWQTSG